MENIELEKWKIAYFLTLHLFAKHEDVKALLYINYNAKTLFEVNIICIIFMFFFYDCTPPPPATFKVSNLIPYLCKCVGG